MLLFAVGQHGRVARVLEKATVPVSNDDLAWIRRTHCSLPVLGPDCVQIWDAAVWTVVAAAVGVAGRAKEGTAWPGLAAGAWGWCSAVVEELGHWLMMAGLDSTRKRCWTGLLRVQIWTGGGLLAGFAARRRGRDSPGLVVAH